MPLPLLVHRQVGQEHKRELDGLHEFGVRDLIDLGVLYEHRLAAR